ncbi:MAG: hypothetical protein ABI743_00915 [bacterium]
MRLLLPLMLLVAMLVGTPATAAPQAIDPCYKLSPALVDAVADFAYASQASALQASKNFPKAKPAANALMAKLADGPGALLLDLGAKRDAARIKKLKTIPSATTLTDFPQMDVREVHAWLGGLSEPTTGSSGHSDVFAHLVEVMRQQAAEYSAELAALAASIAKFIDQQKDTMRDFGGDFDKYLSDADDCAEKP